MKATTKSPDRAERVASVLARAGTLSDELRSTIKDLEIILRTGEEEEPADD